MLEKLGLNPLIAKILAVVVTVIVTLLIIFKGVLVYNEAGYQAHIRTMFGEEKVVSELGYTTKWFGTYTMWPREMTVQSVANTGLDKKPTGDIDGQGSAMISAFPITFLGGVTGTVDSNVRIILPGGAEFIKIARGYRNPDNFILQAVIPAMKNTLQSTAQMMSADDYYAGARSEFAQNFSDQMSDGIYLVERAEIQVTNSKATRKTAVLQDGVNQGEFGDNTTTRITTKKVYDEQGLPIRLEQQFRKLGVLVAEANILNIDPNKQFKDRMILVQQSQADLSVARQDRLKEEEQKLLMTARGSKEVEEQRQLTLKDQIKRTTLAETERQLVLITASREQQRAEIEKATATINFDKAQIEAKTQERMADAEAYEKRVVIQANGALEQKLAAWVEAQKAWAAAAAVAPVPGVVMGGTGGSSGRQADVNDMMAIMATNAAKQLQLDLNIKSN